MQARAWLFSAALLAAGCTEGEPSAPVLVESFDGARPGPLGAALLAERHVEWVEGQGVGNSGAIRVEYRGNTRGSERVIVNYPLPPAPRYTLSFDVKFCPGFDFRKGGKLHGLGPARPVAGGNPVTPPRWSARSMFRAKGGLQSYVYSQSMRGKYGDSVVVRDFNFETERYYAISFQVQLNEPSSASNGFVRIYVNGELQVHHENIRFRAVDTDESLISNLLFNTFHGGDDIGWAPRNNDGSLAITCAYFDNFAVHPALLARRRPGPG